MGACYQLVLQWLAVWVHEDTQIEAAQFSNVVYLQTARRYFYQDGFYLKMISTLKFLSKLKNHVLSYLTGAPWHKDTGIY